MTPCACRYVCVRARLGVCSVVWCGVRLHAALRAIFDRKIDAEPLEVDYNQEHEHCSHQVGHVGQILAVESLLECLPLVLQNA